MLVVSMERFVLIFLLLLTLYGGTKGKTVTSPYYNMEIGRTMIYPRVYNVYHIQLIQNIRVLIIYK